MTTVTLPETDEAVMLFRIFDPDLHGWGKEVMDALVSRPRSSLEITCQVTMQFVQDFRESLQAKNCYPFQRLERLVIRKQDDASYFLARLVCDCIDTVEELEFDNCEFISMESFRDIVVSALSSVKKLTFSYCVLDVDGENVNISHDFVFQSVIDILEDEGLGTLEKLHFPNHTRNFSLVQRLVTLLSETPNAVTELRLSVEDQGAEVIAQGLLRQQRSHFCVERLILTSGHIGDVGAEALGRGIARNTTKLQHLNLRGNHLRGRGVMALEHGLRGNTSLVSLQVDKNPWFETHSERMIQAYCQANRVLREWSRIIANPPLRVWPWAVSALAAHPAVLFAFLHTTAALDLVSLVPPP